MKIKQVQLTEDQRNTVEKYLHIVHTVIRDRITVNEAVFGFSYDDLFQEGCIELIKAVLTFDSQKSVKFETYAYKVVSNGLHTYCRLMCNKQKHIVTVPLYTEEDGVFALDQIADNCNCEQYIFEFDTFMLLKKMKRQYTGTVKLGIEAIEWKLKGLSGRDIADMYGVKPNLIGAWISRAFSKLRKNKEFMVFFGRTVEKQLLK